MNNRRLIGEYPIIGIRPVIDARRGMLDVRGSLEEQTMNMAKAAAELLRNNIKYVNGQAVKVVISDTTIGRVAEAAACEAQFKREGVDITLTVTPCWCYGTETMDMNPMTIKGVWGLNATERPGAVYLAAVLAAHAQKGLPAFGIYGKDVQDADESGIPEDVKEKLLRFSRAAVAVATMKGKSYLQIGSISMGIAGSIINTDFFEEYLGMRVESVDEVEIIRRIEEGIYDKEEFQKALEWRKKYCKEGFDKNPKEVQKSRKEKDEDWEFVIKTTCIIRDLMEGQTNLPKGQEEILGHNAIAGGFQGQRQWTDYYPNTDFAEAIMNSSFDWNGAREPYVLATENDTLNAVSMLFGKLLTNRAQLFADVRTYWSPGAVAKATDGYQLEGKALEAGGFIHLINSGSACLDASGAVKLENGESVIKEWWNITEKDQIACLEATTWNPADLGYFRGSGYSSRFLTKSQMPCTMIRLNLVKGIGPVMQIAEGWTIALPDEVSDKLWKRTDYTWPCTWFAPRTTDKGAFKTAYDVMNNWGANHAAISYGHIGGDIITLCSMLRIPVCMHNVPEEEIFRPAVWNSYGMDKEAADYRACKAYGPMYK